jgi:cyclase
MKRIAALAFLAVASCAFAQDFSKVEVKSTKLNDTTYMLTGAGGNMGLSVGDDAVFLIDDQYAPLTERITAAIKQITPSPVKFVLNTHWHGDHAGGNENLGKAGVLIVAHDNVRKRLNSDQFIELMKMEVKASPKAALPVVTFAGGITFHLNGEEIRVLHMPRAHTDGDAIVHFTKGDVIHMGDIYFNGMYPFIDYSSGGSAEGTIAACDQALALATDKTRVIPGHGPLSNKAELKAYRDMLATVSARVKQEVAAGKKAEEIIAAGATRDFDEKWGKGFMNPAKFVESLAVGMAKNR